MDIYFVCSNLKPTGDQRHTTKDRLDLVYHIMHRHPVNVRRIISAEIFRVRNENLSSYLFPCLINELCRKAGVVPIQGEPTYGPAITMNDKNLLRYQTAMPPVLPDEAEEFPAVVEPADGETTTSNALDCFAPALVAASTCAPVYLVRPPRRPQPWS